MASWFPEKDRSTLSTWGWGSQTSCDPMEGYHGLSQAKKWSPPENDFGLFLLLPRRKLWGFPAATTQQTWGVEFFYLHLGPGVAQTGKPLSLATWPLVISVATMGGGEIFGSICCSCPLNTFIIADYHNHERPNHGRSFCLLRAVNRKRSPLNDSKHSKGLQEDDRRAVS